MRLLVLSDIHGNLDALERVLEEARRLRPDMIVSLGDVVGYGANPNECVALVQEAARIRIGGNHDVAAAGLMNTDTFSGTAQRAIRWTTREIEPRLRDLLGEYDTVRRFGDCVFAHASPLSPLEWEYVYTMNQANAIFAGVRDTFIFIGHTHVPAIIERSEAAGTRVASFALFDTEKATITIRRVPYDIRSAQDKIRSSGLPESLAERLATAR
jgi:diadenosine tetraphosphatase ApaH/serine/threonine PP2A family protein phosphatase